MVNEALYQRVLELGGTKSVAVAIEERYKKSAYTIVAGNPWTVVRYGVPFSSVESIININQYNSDRVDALVWSAMNRISSSGDTYADIENICRQAGIVERGAGKYRELTPPLILARSILEHYKIEDNKIFSYPIYSSEKHIADDLKRIDKNASKNAVPENLIREISRSLEMPYDAEQKTAFECLNHGVSVLTGGPGTGKTSTLKGILSAHQILAKTPIICCAPTGKAAERMRSSTGLDAQTIHKTLGLRPYEKKYASYKAECEIPENALVVVDEASMLDVELASILFHEVRMVKGKLLLVGDEDQLQSVGPGAVLRDVIASGRFFTCRLKTIHRQDGGAIVENSIRIREGKDGLFHDNSFFEAMLFTDEEMVKNVLTLHKRLYNPLSPLDIRIYTPVKNPAYVTSTYQINQMLHQLHYSGVEGFAIGEPVIITKNLYDLGVLNGDEGTVAGTDPLVVRIGESLVEFPEDLECFVELAYAVTVHKAQGSSCKMAIVLLPDQPTCMISRRLLYVALTRAEKRCVVLHQCESLTQAVYSVYEHDRKTLLGERLCGKKR